MAQFVPLNQNDRHRLSQIVDLLGLNQREAAARVGVTQPWLSRLLSGGRENPEAEKFFPFVENLSNALLDSQEAGDTPRADIQNAVEYLRNFNPEFEPPFNPGAVVPLESSKYIERGVDTELLDRLLKKETFCAQVRGPVQTGKTSLLRRLEAKAADKNFHTSWFDTKLSITDVQRVRHTNELVVELARLLHDQLVADWSLGESSLEILSPQRLNNWLKVELATTKNRPRLLILDDLSYLGPEAADALEIAILRPIANWQGQGYNISFVVGTTLQFGPEFQRKLDEVSSIVKWDATLETAWFNHSERRDFYSELTGESAELDSSEDVDLVKALDVFAAGQPLLTHAILSEDKLKNLLTTKYKDWSEANKKKANGERIAIEDELNQEFWKYRPFRTHYRTIKESIVGPALEFDRRVYNLIAAFKDVCTTTVMPAYDEASFLRTSNLARVERFDDRDILVPTIPFYRYIANALFEEFHPAARKL
jgi:transcriptional regulator with XRE-family HTH domain